VDEGCAIPVVSNLLELNCELAGVMLCESEDLCTEERENVV
jgi:hypothetical protein